MADLGRSFATYIVQFARTVDIVDDSLTLDGLRLIFEMNREQP